VLNGEWYADGWGSYSSNSRRGVTFGHHTQSIHNTTTYKNTDIMHSYKENEGAVHSDYQVFLLIGITA